MKTSLILKTNKQTNIFICNFTYDNFEMFCKFIFLCLILGLFYKRLIVLATAIC